MNDSTQTPVTATLDAEALCRINRLSEECAKLDPSEEARLADEGLAADLTAWPEY